MLLKILQIILALSLLLGTAVSIGWHAAHGDVRDEGWIAAAALLAAVAYLLSLSVKELRK